MTTEQLLQALERSGLIAEDLLAKVRRKVNEEPGKVSPASIVRGMVAKGLLTTAQGERLLSAPPPPPAPRPTRAAFDDDLEVLPDDDEGDDLLPPPPQPGAFTPERALAETRAAEDDEMELLPLDEDPLTPPTRTKTSRPTPNVTEPKKERRSEKKKSNRWRSEVPRGKKGSSSDDLMAAESANAAPAQGDRKGRTSTGKRTSNNSWDSPLLLIGGGSLLLLIIIGTVLFLVMGRQTGDQALEAAETDYKAGSYGQAVFKFDHYLEKFPKHGSVGLARVHRGLAQMRQAVDGASDFTKSLATSDRILNEISTEKEFADAHAELAALLPKLANGLAAQASQKPNAELIEKTRQALAMVNKYVPSSQQPAEQLRDIEASLAVTQRRLDRDAALVATVGEMQQAVGAGNVPDVYVSRSKLLATYPELIAEKTLLDAIAAASEAQRSQVKFVTESQVALTQELPTPLLASLALAATSGKAAPVEGADYTVALIAGAAYGLDARSGKLLWRRYVGTGTDYVPQVVKVLAGQSAIVVDAARQELLALDAATGTLRWRQPIADGISADPLVMRRQVTVPTPTGKLLSISRETGESKGYIQVPQPLRVAPAVDPRERFFYQVAEHSNLYVLSAATGECPEIFYLGHESESIAVAPLVVGQYLFVAINSGAEDGVLRVLLMDDNGLKLQAVEQLPLRGHVFAPLEASGRSLLVATDRGAIYSYEIGAPGSGKTLTKVAEKPPDEKPSLVQYAISRGNEMWLAGRGLTRYELQAARGLLAPKWVDNDLAVSLHAPAVYGPVVIYASLREDEPGVTVSAVSGADGHKFWQTRLAVPLATEPLCEPNAEKAALLTASGALYEVPAAGLGGRKLIDAPTVDPGTKTHVPVGAPMARLPDGRCVFPIGRPDSEKGLKEVLIYDPAASNGKLRRKPLPDAAATWPVAFGAGLLVPGRLGQVYLIDPDTGQNLVLPFQPVVEAGEQVAWGQPAVIDDKQVLIFDGATSLYRLAIVDAPKPHLASAAMTELKQRLVSPLVVRGELAYGVDATDQLCSFRRDDLALGEAWVLGSRAVWGPKLVGDRLLVATLSGQITCIDPQPRLAWQTALPQGNLVGMPLVDGGLLAASSAGVVYRLAGDTGKAAVAAEKGPPSGQVDVGQTLSVGPVLWHNRLLLGGGDGTLYVVPIPK